MDPSYEELKEDLELASLWRTLHLDDEEPKAVGEEFHAHESEDELDTHPAQVQVVNDVNDAESAERTPPPEPEQLELATSVSSETSAPGTPKRDKSESRAVQSIIRRLLLDSEAVLLVGESTSLSATIALAAMRGSFDNIWASSLEPVLFERGGTGEAQLLQLVLENLSRCGRDQETHYVWLISGMGLNDLHSLSLHIDATKIAEMWNPVWGELPNIIWFNFPWITLGERWALSRQPGKHAVSTDVLLQEFVKSAASLQKDGGVLLIALTLNPVWTSQYRLEALLETAERAGYKHYEEHITDDNSLLRECVSFGYLHRSTRGKDIHKYVVENGSVLHIFIKDSQPCE